MVDVFRLKCKIMKTSFKNSFVSLIVITIYYELQNFDVHNCFSNCSKPPDWIIH